MRFTQEVLSCDAAGCFKSEAQERFEPSSWFFVLKEDFSTYHFEPMRGAQKAWYACSAEHAKAIIQEQSKARKAEIDQIAKERLEEIASW